jgi:hypothetical protein
VLRHRPLADALQGYLENLGPMNREELRAAICRPAANANVSFESGLVETLLDDVESKPGSLPLLQFALREMWGRQEKRVITRRSYDDIGGVDGVLAQRTETIFVALTENGKNQPMEQAFQRLFTRLVTLGEGQEDTRRVVERRKLGDEVWSLAQRLGNADWQIDLSVSLNKVGDVQVAQSNLPAALTSYQASRAIRERLAKSDPGNAGWQRNLSLSYDRVGDVQVAQGDLPPALTSYQASRGIRERLAKSDPANVGWQSDLSTSYANVSDVQVAQSNLPAALTSYQAGLAIRERLAKSDPGNAGWQYNLSVSYKKVGDMILAVTTLPQALAAGALELQAGRLESISVWSLAVLRPTM